MKWIKNSGDAFGNVYGQHENYEVCIARGWRLSAWRIGLVCLLPLLLIYRLLAAIWLAAMFSIGSRRKSVPAETFVDEAFSNKPSQWMAQPTSTLSPVTIRISAAGLRYLHWPIAILLHLFIYALVLIPHRRWMGGFLASRSVVDGSGHLDRQSRFWLSARAASTSSMIGFGRYWDERPIFMTGHWLRALLTEGRCGFSAWLHLWNSTQRIQITLGDSTPNEHSQYLRIGTTCLVLDLIESQYTERLPIFQNCLAVLRTLTTDPLLIGAVTDIDRHSWTAIELQRHYASAVRYFLTHARHSSDEAWGIIDQWQMTLDQLQESEHDSDCHRWLLGRVDWVSKRWLIHQAAGNATWAVQKKIDLKYHELSNEGYHQMLIKSLDIAPLVEPDELNRAMRMPPVGTPATRRGYWIREFTGDFSDLQVNWQSVQWTDERGDVKRMQLT